MELTSPLREGEATLRTGRILFAASVAAFGIQHLIYGKLRPGLPPFPSWMFAGHRAAYLLGIGLLTLGVLLAFRVKLYFSSIALGLVLLIGSGLQFFRLHEVVTNGNARTQAFEALTLSGIAWVLAAESRGDATSGRFLAFGRTLFCVSMLVFGLQHLEYLTYLTTLVPKWLPFHSFWIVFTGAAFLAASLSIFTGVARRLASVLLSAMFLGWVCMLHLPRIATHLRNGDEWSSGFVALALCGGSLLMAQPKPD